MLSFTLHEGLPKAVGRYQRTVEQMMEGIQVARDQECYLMVDEKEVLPHDYHRRPGLHIDGYWHAPMQCHGGHHPSPPPPYREPTPPREYPKHGSTPPTKKARGEALLLASTYSAARALTGSYERDFIGDWRGGDCAELGTFGMEELQLLSGIAYHMDVFTVHESLPIREPVRRTLVRINVPGGQF
jgi:hypothetical protein